MKFRYLILILFFSFLIGLSARASDVLSIDGTFSDNFSFNNNNGYENNGQSFTAVNANISKITLKTGVYGETADQFNLKIREHVASTTILFNQDFTGLDLDSSEINLQISPPVSLNIGTVYDMVWTQLEECTDSCWSTRGDVNHNDFYAGGQIMGDYQADGDLGSDYWFKIYYDDTYFSPGTWSVIASYPEGGMTFASTTISLIINYHIPEGQSAYVFAWTEKGGGYQLHDFGLVATSTGTVIKSVALTDGTYNWYAQLIDSDTMDNRATSTTETFTVSTFGDIDFLSPCADYINGDVCTGIATSTLTDWHFFGDIECGLKRFGLWAVCPSQTSVASTYQLYQDFKETFPFNAFFAITDSLQEAIATTTLTLYDTIPIPFISKTTSTTPANIYTIPVLSSTTLSNAIGISNNNLFRTTMGYILWCGMALIIFLQIRAI